MCWYQSCAWGGITHSLWNKSGSEHILYSGSCMSDSVLAWYLHVLSGMSDQLVEGLASHEWCGDMKQHLTFDLGMTTSTGSSQGAVTTGGTQSNKWGMPFSLDLQQTLN